MAKLALVVAAVIGAMLMAVGLLVPLCCARPCPAGVECYPPPWINEAVFFGGVAIVVVAAAAYVYRFFR